MTILNDYFSYTVAGHYLTAIINDDYTGLSDSDANRVNRFLSEANNLPDATWQVEEGRHFAICEISGLYADCYEVKLYFTNPSLQEKTA
jgi:hypothetical protein